MGKESPAGERRRAGAFRVNVKKHSAAALGEYLDRHPQRETTEVRIKIEQQSTLSRDKLAEIVRQLVEEKMGTLLVSSREPEPTQVEDEDRELSEMLNNLDLFL